MKTYEKEATVVICDGCQSEHLQQVDGDDLDVFGYFGTVMNHHAGGGVGADWFACKEECIIKAIRGALKEAWG